MPDDVETTQSTNENATATATTTEQSGTVDQSAGSDSSKAASGSNQPTGSLTAPHNENAVSNGQQSTAQPQQTSGTQPDQWKEHYHRLQASTERKLLHAKNERQQFQAEMQELREFKRTQAEAAQRQNLKRWSKQHPENGKFRGVLERAKAVDSQLRNIPNTLPPEQQDVMKQAILSAMSPEDRQELDQYREEVSQFHHGFFEDPHGTLAPLIQPMIAEALQRERAQMHAHQRVGQDFESPELKPLVQAHAPEIQKALDDGVPYDYAVHMLKMFGELERMQTQMKGLGRDAAMGKEQVRLAQGNAAITRDPAPAKNIDVYALAKKQALERGYSTADPRFLRDLADIEKSNSSF